MVVAPIAAGREAGPARAAELDERRARHGRPAQCGRCRSARSSGCTSPASCVLDDALQADLRRTASQPPAPADLPRLPRRLRRSGGRRARRSGAARRARAGAHLRALRRLRRPTATCSPGCARTTGRVAASFVNWVGRTRAADPRGERAAACAGGTRAAPTARRAPARRSGSARELVAYVAAEVGAGRLALTPPAPTPLGWQLAQARQPRRGAAARPRRPAVPDRSARRSSSVQLRRARERATRRSARARAPPISQALQALEDHDIDQPVHRARRGQARAVSTLAADACCWCSTELRLPPYLHSRLPGAGADDPLRALVLLRRQDAASSS